MILDVTYDGVEFKAQLVDFESLIFGADSIENDQFSNNPIVVATDFKVFLKEIMKAIRKELEYKFIV